MEGRTFEFSFSLPGAAKSKKNHPKATGPGRTGVPKTRNNQAPKAGGVSKPKGHDRPLNRNGTSQATSPAKAGDTRQDRREYERLRRQRPERKEAHRRAEQKRRLRAKQLGLCRQLASPPFQARPGVRPAPRPTGSPAGAATPTEGPRPRKRQRPARQTRERGRGIIRNMTTINDQDDFLEALRNNPQWRDAVRAQVLGEDLLHSP